MIEDLLEEEETGRHEAAGTAAAILMEEVESEDDDDWESEHKALVEKAKAKEEDSEPVSSSSSSEGDSDESSSSDDEEEASDAAGEATLDRTAVTLNGPAAKDHQGKPLCWVCVASGSNIEEDELVRCRGCGLHVHIGCYGNLVDPGSDADSVASDEEEPWMCEACCAGVFKPVCALCPNDGGAFKQCDLEETWVHAICSLYVQGVYWGSPETMRPVILSKIPVASWGSRRCDLCKDPDNARAGVLVKCDAGMCRSWMHATCAQRHGLLQEASAADDIADPYFASCKVHCEKLGAKSARRRWLALERQQHVAAAADRGDAESAAAVVAEYRRERQEWINDNSEVISASKRYLVEVRRAVSEREERRQAADRGPIRPELTIAFVQRYLELDTEQQKLADTMATRKSEHVALSNSARDLRDELERLETTRKLANERRSALVALVQLIRTRMAAVGCNLKQPQHWQAPKRRQALATSASSADSARTASGPKIFEAPRCRVCSSTDEPFLMALCDTCNLHVHTRCHDPPLKRVPKKGKYRLWQCADCDSSEDESDSGGPNTPAIDVDAPRPVRSRRGLPPTRFDIHEMDEDVAIRKALSKSKERDSKEVRSPKEALERESLPSHVSMAHDDGALAALPVKAAPPDAKPAPRAVRNSRTPREFDPETMCGVPRQDTPDKRLCRRSLACKLHRLSDRRAVSGRSRDFDSLLETHLKAIGKWTPKRIQGHARPQASAKSGVASASITPPQFSAPPTRDRVPNLTMDAASSDFSVERKRPRLWAP